MFSPQITPKANQYILLPFKLLSVIEHEFMNRRYLTSFGQLGLLI